MNTLEAMQLAIKEAHKGASFVSPNPLVGCVILDAAGNFLQSGHHEVYGGPHAEINALKGLNEVQLRGAHVIVTLEPCAHEGKTPSCAKALARLPIKKVTFGLIDPNPLVAGQGATLLKAAGIEAEVFHDEDPERNQAIQNELEDVCEIFLKNFRQKKLFIALKLGTSLDGQIALKSGESHWITGPQSREYVHQLRSHYDAVLIGSNTLRVDDPALNIRHPQVKKTNKVVVLDPDGAVLFRYPQLKIASVHEDQNVIWCLAAVQRPSLEPQIQQMERRPQICWVNMQIWGDLDLNHLHEELWNKGLRSLMIEGGAQTANIFLREKHIDRLLLFQAPILMGAGGSISWTSHLKIASMQEKITLQHVKIQQFAFDIFVTGRVNYPNIELSR